MMTLLFQNNDKLIIAPNSPNQLFHFLKKYKIKFQIGNIHVDDSFENSVKYNCVSTNNYLLHKKGFTDAFILKNNTDKKFVNLPQAYTRCSMMHLKDNIFISSDLGIKKVLDRNNLKNFYFSPENIKIVDHKNSYHFLTHLYALCRLEDS